MATLASFIFALTLSPNNLEPRIDWVFTATACSSCTDAQIEVMAQYYREGDHIYLQAASKNKRWAAELVKRFKTKFPKARLTKGTAPYKDFITGWILRDPATQEEISYQTKQDRYGRFRSQAMLELFRDPNDP